MALTLTATAAPGLIRTIALTWEGQTGRYVTVYRSTSEIDIHPADGAEINWSAADVIGSKIQGTELKDAGLEAGTYYYYVTDGIEIATASASVPAGGDYAHEIQADYEAVGLSSVTSTDSYLRALNSSGSVKLNTLKVPAGPLAIVAITAESESNLTEMSIGEMVLGLTGATGFAVLQKGTVESFDGYGAQLSGSTQVKYVKE